MGSDGGKVGHDLTVCKDGRFVRCSICKQEMPKVSLWAIPCIDLAWTKEKPTNPGWYWWKHNDEWGKSLIMVISVNADLYSPHGFVSELDGEWAGPLEPPI